MNILSQELVQPHFRGYGSSIKKSATDTGNDGMAYRIYGCGIKALGHGYNKNRNQHNVSDVTDGWCIDCDFCW